MYDLHDYARMIADETRMGPYTRALEAVVKPGSVVVDVGTGTGIFALLACRLGARRVYAIETNDAIEVARELAHENGCGDRIVFLQKDARDVELAERADVVVSDLRGLLPLFADHLAIVAGIRERFLKPGGAMIPLSDALYVAVVERADLYETATGPAHGPLGVTLGAMQARLRNCVLRDRKEDPLRPDDIVSQAAKWATIDYQVVQPAPVAGGADLRITRPSRGHGLVVWFEAVLSSEDGFSLAPGQEGCYGRLFLPWPRAVSLEEGDGVRVELWAQPNGGPWGWNSLVTGSQGLRAAFKQSSFLAAASRPQSIRSDASSGAPQAAVATSGQLG